MVRATSCQRRGLILKRKRSLSYRQVRALAYYSSEHLFRYYTIIHRASCNAKCTRLLQSSANYRKRRSELLARFKENIPIKGDSQVQRRILDILATCFSLYLFVQRKLTPLLETEKFPLQKWKIGTSCSESSVSGLEKSSRRVSRIKKIKSTNVMVRESVASARGGIKILFLFEFCFRLVTVLLLRLLQPTKRKWRMIRVTLLYHYSCHERQARRSARYKLRDESSELNRSAGIKIGRSRNIILYYYTRRDEHVCKRL